MRKAIVLFAVVAAMFVFASCSTTEKHHEFDEGRIERELSDFREGILVHTCTVCGEKEYEPIRDASCEYSEDGFVTRREYEESDFEIYTYREANIVDSVYYDPEGIFVYKNVFYLDDDFNAVAEEGYYPTGELYYYQDYDGHFHVTVYKEYNPDGTINSWYGYEYDSEGNRVVVNSYNPDGSLDYSAPWE